MFMRIFNEGAFVCLKGPKAPVRFFLQKIMTWRDKLGIVNNNGSIDIAFFKTVKLFPRVKH